MFWADYERAGLSNIFDVNRNRTEKTLNRVRKYFFFLLRTNVVGIPFTDNLWKQIIVIN